MKRSSQSLARMTLAVLFIAGALGSASQAQRTLLQTVPAPAPSSTANLPDLTATQAVELLCSRQVTAYEYATALLDRYEGGGWECINAFITLNATKVLEDAAAIDAKAEAGESILPLCGLPLAVKDAIDVVGYPTTAATPGLADAYPLLNPPLIQAYLAANGIILGKTNLAEMQATLTSINPTSNGITTPLNAYDPTRIAGGSSGGSASAVAARIAPFALCEDTAGSCRAPALANGIFGLRTTLGSYNLSDGVVPAFFTRDTIGSFGRTMDDLILLDSIVRPKNCTTTLVGALPAPISCVPNITRDLNLTGLRLGLPSGFGWSQGISSEVANVTNAALDKLRAAGVVLVPFDSTGLTNVSAKAWGGQLPKSSAYETSDTTSRYLYRHNYTISLPQLYAKINRPDTRSFYLSTLTAYGDTVLGSDENWVEYLKNSRPKITKYWQDTLANNSFNALLYPGFRTEISKVDGGDNWVPFTNTSGTFLKPYYAETFFELDALAGMTVGAFPIGMGSTGTPAGLQVAAVPGGDGTVMSLMLAMEKLLGDMPAPSAIPACAGCVANVTNIVSAYAGPQQPNATDVWTNFGLTFDGDCHSTELSSYGRSGPLGVGVVKNVTGPIATVTGVTSTSTAG